MKKLASILLSVLMLTSVIAGASAETFTGDDNGIGPVTVALTCLLYTSDAADD